MYFKVHRPFVWETRPYEAGEVIEIPDNHPRLNGMLLGRYIQYESGERSPANSTPPLGQGLSDDPLSQAIASAGIKS